MSHRQPFKPSPAPEPSKDTSSITSQNDTGTTKKLSIAQNSTEIAPVLNLSGLKRSKYKNAERIPAAHALEQNRTLDSSSLQSTPSQPSSNHFSTSFAMPAPLNHSIRGSPAFMLPSAFDSSARAESARTPSHTNSSNSHSSFRPTSSATHTTHPLLRPASAAPFSSTAQSNIRAFSRSVQRPASVAPVSAPLPNELTPADIGTHSHQHDLSTEYWPSEQQGQMTVGDRDYNEYDDNTENEENVPPFQSGGFEVHSTYNSPAPDGHNHQTWGNAHVVSEKRRRSEECSSEREGGHVDSGSDSRKRMRLSAPLNQQSGHLRAHRLQPHSNHQKVPNDHHSQQAAVAAGVHHEFDLFFLKESERVNLLREKWTQCTLEEWKEAGEDLTKKFGELTMFVQEHMTKKIQQFASIQSRVDGHNEELDKRDDLLRTARMSLVSRTGALVGGEEHISPTATQ